MFGGQNRTLTVGLCGIMKRRYYKEPRISQFRALVELSQIQGFAATARKLGLSTPSVWQQVRALEDEFKVPLIDTVGQSVKLTQQGQLLVELAEPIVQGFDSILEQFSRESESIPSRLSIASPADILATELAAPIRDYHDHYVNVDLSLIDAPSNTAKAMLEAGEVDLAVVGQLAESFPKSLAYDSVTRFQFTLVCPVNHPVLDRPRLNPRALARYPLVMSGIGTNTRTRVDEVFANAGLIDKLRIVCETSTKHLLLQSVENGFGIAIVPLSQGFHDRYLEQNDLSRRLAFVDMSTHFGCEHIVILRRRHRRETTHQLAFRELVLSILH